MKGYMILTEKDLDDGKKLDEIYTRLSPSAKMQAEAYMSALLDKEMADQSNKKAG